MNIDRRLSEDAADAFDGLAARVGDGGASEGVGD